MLQHPAPQMENQTSRACGAQLIVCLAMASIAYAGTFPSARSLEISARASKAVSHISSGYKTASGKSVRAMTLIRVVFIKDD